MLLTYEQMKHLKTNSDETFTAKIEKMSDKEKNDLKDVDDMCYELYGHHLIKNYKDLHTDK